MPTALFGRATTEEVGQAMTPVTKALTDVPFFPAFSEEGREAAFRGVTSATESGATDSLKPFAKQLRGETEPFNPFTAHDQSGYRYVPARKLAAAIRASEGPTLKAVDGPSRIVFGEDNSIQHVFFDKQASPAEKADTLITAGYAALLKTDVLAAEAASKVEGQSIGFISRPIERVASAEEMQKSAVEGAQAYVKMDPAAANRYTSYLAQRFGPMTEDSQTWERHIMIDSKSPESGWNPQMRPATETLLENGLPISPLHRAVAANPNVLSAQPWLRGPAIRGGAQYLQARAGETFPQDVNNLVTDAWYGSQGPSLSPEVIKTVGSITQAFGERASVDFSTIDKVAAIVGAHGRPEEYIGAYKSVKEAAIVMARMQEQRVTETAGPESQCNRLRGVHCHCDGSSGSLHL